ncbi:MAG: peptidoglycan DD-metalloendopeptidase family protein [Gammaproteobacteria bacterium]|nr:peptidoglycan DD-metalloendopeptidase family protein [Gammaproteobacteria bacterium]
MKRALSVVVLCLLLVACGGRQVAAPVRAESVPPPAERAAPVVSASGQARQAAGGYYRVQRGDTLYSIAWQYGLDYKTLAQWNRIRAPYRIYAGQTLSLKPTAVTAETQQTTPASPQQRKPATTPADKAPPPQPSPNEDVAAAAARPVWAWPTRGEVIATFNADGNKGINIAGREGDAINAAAEGRVVYSGNGLVGLGELVIIKHNGTFLSAYAHNKLRLVKEGDLVKSGQTIAHMGRTGSDRVMLHFEVRRDGKPVDPLHYLPRQR